VFQTRTSFKRPDQYDCYWFYSCITCVDVLHGRQQCILCLRECATQCIYCILIFTNGRYDCRHKDHAQFYRIVLDCYLAWESSWMMPSWLLKTRIVFFKMDWYQLRRRRKWPREKCLCRYYQERLRRWLRFFHYCLAGVSIGKFMIYLPNGADPYIDSFIDRRISYQPCICNYIHETGILSYKRTKKRFVQEDMVWFL